MHKPEAGTPLAALMRYDAKIKAKWGQKLQLVSTACSGIEEAMQIMIAIAKEYCKGAVTIADMKSLKKDPDSNKHPFVDWYAKHIKVRCLLKKKRYLQ